jgi:hypothetical protein
LREGRLPGEDFSTAKKEDHMDLDKILAEGVRARAALDAAMQGVDKSARSLLHSIQVEPAPLCPHCAMIDCGSDAPVCARRRAAS